MASFSTRFYFTTSEITKLVVRNLSGVDYTFTQSGVAQQIEGTAGDRLTVTATLIDGYKIKSVVNGAVVDKTHFTIPLGTEVFSVNSGKDLPVLATPTNLSLNGNILTFDAVEHATSYMVSANYRRIGTYEVETGYTISWSGGGKTPGITALINGDTQVHLTDSTGSINNVKTVKFFASFNSIWAATINSTTLNLDLSGNSGPAEADAGSVDSAEYTLTQDVADLVISRDPRKTNI